MRSRQQGAPQDGPASLIKSELLSCLLLFLIVVGAALLRFYRLDTQSFWNDEGNSARIAERSVDLILTGAAGDVHPPGYYLLLHAWRGLVGSSEFALRALSVVAGLVLVVFTYLLGRELFGRWVGLVAAILSSVSPLGVYYSQEARMYALLGALSAASIYLAFRAWGRGASVVQDEGDYPGVPILALFALVGAAGLYTHYAFVLVLVAHNVAFGLRWILRAKRSKPRWRSLSAWLGAHVGICLLYVPWLRAALNAAGWSSAGGTDHLGRALLDVLRVLAVGVTQSIEEGGPAIAGAAALLIVGLLPGRRGTEAEGTSRGWWHAVGLGVYVGVPLALFFLLDLYKPAWLKFLMVVLPPFHVLVARGIENMADVVSGAGGFLHGRRSMAQTVLSCAGVVGFSVLLYPSLHNLYFDPAYARDDYRQIAADIRDLRRPDDAIVLNAPNQWEVFTYYYPDRDVYPAPYRPGPGKASRFLGPLLDEYERLFVLYWGDAESDPQRRIESWLATHAYKASDRWYGDVRLSVYGIASLSQEPDVRVDAMFGDGILLEGYTLALEDHFLPGDIAPVTLFWEAQESIEEPYKVSVQMVDRQRRLLSQVDSVPNDGLTPTTSWRRGDRLVDRYGVWISEGAANGEHELRVVVYHASHGERLQVQEGGQSVGDSLVVTDIEVEAGRK